VTTLSAFGKERAALLACLAVIGCTAVSAEADCSRPCGSPLSGNAQKPSTSDSLYILRSAVGGAVGCYLCECDVNRSGDLSTSDALANLRAAVGLPVNLRCPACEETDSSKALQRGRTALERHDLFWADDEFACAIDADGTNSAAKLFHAVTRIARYVAEDAEVRDLLDDTGGEGSTDAYDFTLSFPLSTNVPTVARAKPVLLDTFANKLDDALDELSSVVADTEFKAIVTRKMAPGDFSEPNTAYEADAADAAILSSLYRSWRCLLLFSIGSYHSSTFDLLREDPTTACYEEFPTDYPSFLTVASTPSMQTAKAECRAAVNDLLLALDRLESEVDAQGNDLFLYDDLGTEKYGRSPRTLLTAVLNSFDDVTTMLPRCNGSPFPFELGRLFDAPVTRKDLPTVYTDPLSEKCKADRDSFPDLSYNGVLPDAPEIAELERLELDWWPICRP
jgi:hypothetical protein